MKLMNYIVTSGKDIADFKQSMCETAESEIFSTGQA
jgi:hypothetical protein